MNIHAWNRIGTDQNTLNYITEGVKIPFVRECPQFHLKNYHVRDSKERIFLKSEIKRLLDLGYIKQSVQKPDFLSPIGCVRKKGNNKYRLIHDLRFLNNHCETKKFKQEDIRVVEQIIQPNDYLTSIDLKDGFFHIKVHEDFQKYLSFEFNEKFYSFTVLCFGLCLSPYFFYKCLRPVVAYLRSLDIRLALYVDDFLICADKAHITDHTDTVLHTLQDLGLHVNSEKSSLEPSQNIEFLGFIVSTHGQYPCISAKKERVCKIKRLLKNLLKKQSCSARLLARCAGLCVSTAWVVTTGKLYLRNIYSLISKRKHWEDIIELDKTVYKELSWWLDNIDKFNLKFIKPNPITASFEVDASESGWGAALGDCLAKGNFDRSIARKSSNFRELTAVLLAILAFNNKLKEKHVLIFSDNTTAIAYINNRGGPHNDLTELAIKIWQQAEKLGLSITCRHLAGIANVTADRLSRSPDRHNWMLNPNLFQFLEELWGPHSVDRFATFQNRQVLRYNSRFWDVGTEAVDAFSQQWSGENNYVNAPWALLPRIIEKLVSDRAVATVIAPNFRAQPWHQNLRRLALYPPLTLPYHKNTLVYQGAQAEPKKNPRWKVQAWRVSGHLG